ncbi:hypothetical protein [uncultured Dokdonia sp.]|uniref:hypothetical protein n=1 Tax=uncultured Dokdonia sp. TaxID=575653 RepID=UPI002627121E|nr:hypothetical protein [uncultured Dokdonia sp.]
MEEGGVIIFQLVLRIIGAVVCSNRAKDLNRSTSGWGFFGFVLPIIAMIWIYCLKPKMQWDNNVDINKES